MPLFAKETEVKKKTTCRLSAAFCLYIAVWQDRCYAAERKVVTAAQRIGSSFSQNTEIYNQMHKEGHSHSEVLHLSQRLFS